jgi:hypothetical protein
MYQIYKSTENSGTLPIGSATSMEEAVEIAKKKGAKGGLERKGAREWMFKGGSKKVGYWIGVVES